MKNTIQSFYNHEYTGYFQALFPTLLKYACNKNAGKPLDNGMMIANITMVFGRSAPTTPYLVTSLLYSALSRFGYSSHTTVYAAKMIYNLIYGGKYYTEFKQHDGTYQYKCQFSDFTSSILLDSASFLIAHTGFRMILGESYPAQILVSFLSKYAVCALAARFMKYDKMNNILATTAFDTITELAMPIDTASPFKDYIPEFMHSLHQEVIKFTDSGLSFAL